MPSSLCSPARNLDHAFRVTFKKEPRAKFYCLNQCVEMLYKVAEFPESLATPNGNILVAPVHGFSNSKKRKRSELAVALDSESVNLYDV